jgi:thaumarchaeosortase
MLLSKPRVITPFIYTVGMACFLYIDVVLPYNSLGPFQYVVPPVLGFVVLVLNAMGLGHSSAAGNILHLTTAAGSMDLQVFWPSAGLQGIVIGLLAVATISVKLDSGWRRGSIYMLIGVAGSFLVNVLRIVLLAAYAMGAINDPKGFERFHSVAGELVFIPWILIVITLVVRHELKIKATTGTATTRVV